MLIPIDKYQRKKRRYQHAVSTKSYRIASISNIQLWCQHTAYSGGHRLNKHVLYNEALRQIFRTLRRLLLPHNGYLLPEINTSFTPCIILTVESPKATKVGELV